MRNYMYHFHTTFVIFIYPDIVFAKSKKSESELSLIYKHAHCPLVATFCLCATQSEDDVLSEWNGLPWGKTSQLLDYANTVLYVFSMFLFLFLKTFPLLILTKPRRQYEDVKNYIICCHGGASKSTYLMKTTIKVWYVLYVWRHVSAFSPHTTRK